MRACMYKREERKDEEGAMESAKARARAQPALAALSGCLESVTRPRPRRRRVDEETMQQQANLTFWHPECSHLLRLACSPDPLREGTICRFSQSRCEGCLQKIHVQR